MAELLTKWDAGQRDVHAGLDGAGRELDLRRHADADRLRLPGLGHDLADAVLDPVEEGVGADRDGRMLAGMRRRRPFKGGDGDLRTTYVHSKDHAEFLMPGT